MIHKKIVIGFNNQKIKLSVYECSLFEKISGLMFSRREKANILLFSFRRKQKIAIHSFFVFYPFIALWLDDKNKIIDKKIVTPFELSVCPQEKFLKLIEIPINKKNRKLSKLFFPEIIRRQY